jgi:hypothetical protein
MLKFSVQTFYQPFFNIFPLSNCSLFLAFSFQQFFSLPKASHSKKPKVKPQKAKKPLFLLQGSLIAANRWSHREGRDIATGETCIPASLNAA